MAFQRGAFQVGAFQLEPVGKIIRHRGRRILDVSEMPEENTVSQEVDALLALEPKPAKSAVEEIDLLAKLPALKYKKRQKNDAKAVKVKKSARETEIAILLMEFLD